MNDVSSAIKDCVSVKDLCDLAGITINRSGFARCPFHGEKTASMKVYSDASKGFHCFGCGCGGDVIDFAQLWYGTDFRQTIRKLNDDFQLGLELDKPPSTKQRESARIERELRELDRIIYQMRLETAEMAYWSAFDEWMKCDTILHQNAPESPFEAFTERFAWALTRKDEIAYNLDVARDKLEQVRSERRRRYFATGSTESGSIQPDRRDTSIHERRLPIASGSTVQVAV